MIGERRCSTRSKLHYIFEEGHDASNIPKELCIVVDASSNI
jgi:hypothetical protein